MTSRPLFTAACAFGLAAWAAGAAAAPLTELEIPSCVSDSPAMRVPANAERAALDAGDRKRFQDAALAKYPLYRQTSLLPAQVLMLKRGKHWQYVTLWPKRPAGYCFSAVFAADRFDFTPGWLEKYRPRAGDLDD